MLSTYADQVRHFLLSDTDHVYVRNGLLSSHVLHAFMDDGLVCDCLVDLYERAYCGFHLRGAHRRKVRGELGRIRQAGWREALAFVEAQDEYALRSRTLYNVNQYAQRIVSTPGKQDGLTWLNDNDTWVGPIGEQIAKAIAQGYTPGETPYHGYFYKVLKGQGSAAPLGKLDYVIEGVMIGGFALVAAPAQYRVTGVKTFMVSYDGVVYEKDLGPDTLEQFKKVERFNPDLSWQPVKEQ